MKVRACSGITHTITVVVERGPSLHSVLQVRLSAMSRWDDSRQFRSLKGVGFEVLGFRA